MRKFIQYICLPLALAAFCGCTSNEGVDSDDQQARIRFEVAPVAFSAEDGVVFSSARIIAVDSKNKVAYNQTTATGLSLKPGTTDIFEIELPAGNYLLYTIVNETPGMGRQLDAVNSADDLKTVTITGSFSEENIPLAQTEQITLRGKGGQSEVSADGGATWKSRITTELVRTQSKATLYLRKMTGTQDVVVVKKVEICNLPDYCYLLPRSYVPAKQDMQTITPYDDATGIRFDTDITDETAKDNYTAVVTTGNIFPERRTDTPDSDTDAAFLKIYAEYNGLSTTYTIALHGDADNGYNLARNVNHIVYATITGSGELDANKIYIRPQWWDTEVSGDIEIPYLNISETIVPLKFSLSSDEKITLQSRTIRIFFWSNVPAADISIGDKITSSDGMVFDTADMAATELHITRSDPAADGSYNTTGYVDLTPTQQLAEPAFSSRTNDHSLTLIAGNLHKSILLRRPNFNSTTFDEMPWTGIYYDLKEKGERIIDSYNEGPWTATMEYPAGTTEFVLLDRSISQDEYLYTEIPNSAENYPVTSGKQTVSGEGRIYFRSGLTGTSTVARAARIKLETNSGTHYIYIKQGTYVNVMRSTDAAAAINSDGSLGGSVTRTSGNVKSISQSPSFYYSYNAAGGSNLTSHYTLSSYTSYPSALSNSGFPTQAKSFFCWNTYNGYTSGSYYYYYIFHPTNPWTGPITPYPLDRTASSTASYATSVYRDGCPSGYRQPTVDQLRYSLFKNIPDKDADGNYAMAANPDDRNYQWGYYADGFFDRRTIRSVESNTGAGTVTTPPCAVSSDLTIAYTGILFYNPDSFMSLFLPATGYRDAANGELRMAGLGGFVWTQTSKTTTDKYGLSFSCIDGKLDCRIVCGVSPARAASFRCIKL